MDARGHARADWLRVVGGLTVILLVVAAIPEVRNVLNEMGRMVQQEAVRADCIAQGWPAWGCDVAAAVARERAQQVQLSALPQAAPFQPAPFQPARIQPAQAAPAQIAAHQLIALANRQGWSFVPPGIFSGTRQSIAVSDDTSTIRLDQAADGNVAVIKIQGGAVTYLGTLTGEYAAEVWRSSSAAAARDTGGRALVK